MASPAVAVHTEQRVIGPIFMSKPTSLARCLWKQIGRCKPISEVQAKRFDDCVARGKLSRDQWLQCAYDTTIGVSSRKRNFEVVGNL